MTLPKTAQRLPLFRGARPSASTGGEGGTVVFDEGARCRAIAETLAAAGALFRLDLIAVARFAGGGADRRFRADLAAQAAGVANGVVDSNLHRPANGCRRPGAADSPTPLRPAAASRGSSTESRSGTCPP